MDPKTPEEFLNWVASWVLDGDPIVYDADNYPDDQYEYELENDEVYENYTTIVATARRLAGKKD